MHRRPWVAIGLALAVSLVAASPGRAGPCLIPPVDAPVADPFRAPECPWCPGNRGLEFATDAGQPVVAAAAGVVTFAGQVANVRYVVVDQPDGLRATYGRLDASNVGRGDRVVAGSVLGTTSGSLYFGLRRDGVYVDPAPLIGRPELRPRLVPVDGTARRAAPPPRWRCAGAPPGAGR